MSNTIGRSSPPSFAAPPVFYRGEEPRPARDRSAEDITAAPPTDSYRRWDRPDFFRGGGPNPAERPETEPVGRGLDRAESGEIIVFAGPGARRAGGALAEFASMETAALEVKTDDGDTVTITFEALKRIQAGGYPASAQTLSAESSVNVQVRIEGKLDDEEVSQIGDLLERLVTTARYDEPKTIQTSGLKSLDNFHFAYDSYRRAGLALLDARVNSTALSR